MSAEILNVTAADGHRFDLTLYPAQHANAPALMICPAMGTPARVYAPLAQAFAQEGVNTAVLELRGIGSSSLRASRAVDYGYRTLTEQDWPAARAALRARLPQSPIYLLGHSLGGQVSLLSAAQKPDDLAGVVIVASGSVYHRGWSGVRGLGILAFTQFAGLLAGMLGYFPGKRVGFGGTEAGTLMRDWARLGRTGRFALAGGEDIEPLLARTPVRVLGISFEHDRFAPHTAQALLLGKLPQQNVVHLPLAAKDTGDKLDHYNWIKNSKAVTSRVAGFMKGDQS